MNDEEQIKVDNIGPIVRWEKPQGWKSPLFVLSTQLENKIIEYHMSSTEFTNEYKESLKKSVFVDNLEEFFTQPPPITTRTRSKGTQKRKSIPDSDSDYDDSKYKDPSSDEDFLPSAKKSKYSKVSFVKAKLVLKGSILTIFIGLSPKQIL